MTLSDPLGRTNSMPGNNIKLQYMLPMAHLGSVQQVKTCAPVKLFNTRLVNRYMRHQTLASAAQSLHQLNANTPVTKLRKDFQHGDQIDP